MFSFSSLDPEIPRLSLSPVMMLKEQDGIVVVNPRNKAILRFTNKSFLSLLDLDGIKMQDIDTFDSGSFHEFLGVLLHNGILERLTSRGSAYDVTHIRKLLANMPDGQNGIILNPPVLPTININETCKFRCPHCYNNTNHNMASEMDTEIIINNIIKPLANIGCTSLMWSGGDPVLSKDKTINCTKVASSLGIKVATQAAEFSPIFLREFVAAGGRGIQFSIFSSPSHPEIDDKFKGRVGSWDITYKNIVESRMLGLSVFINMILFPDNMDEFEETAEFVYDLGVDTFRITIPVITGQAIHNKSLLDLTDQQIKNLLIRAVALNETYDSRMNILNDVSGCGDPMHIPYSFCSAGMTYIHVAGYKVFPCNFMMDERFYLGSIKNQTIDKIWREALVLRDFRTTERINEICVECNNRETIRDKHTCTDCKAVMWMQYNEFLNPRTVPCNIKKHLKI